jgi:hypothetical protein
VAVARGQRLAHAAVLALQRQLARRARRQLARCRLHHATCHQPTSATSAPRTRRGARPPAPACPPCTTPARAPSPTDENNVKC